MSDELKKEGKWTVLRDSAGNLVTKTITKKSERENWRSIMRKLTDGGQMPMRVAVEMAEGRPFVAKLEDGTMSEPVTPNASIRLVAAQWLHEQMYGKAVVQTEVTKAEAETRLQAQVQALSDEELQAKAFAALEKRGILTGDVGKPPEPPTEDDDGSDPSDSES